MATFLERLKELQGDVSDAEFARRCGIRYTTMKNYLQGRSLPPLDVAGQIADSFGKSIDWLFGKDPARAGNVQAEAVRVIGKLVADLNAEASIRLSPGALIAEVVRHFDALMSKMDDPDDPAELESMVPWLENRIRKEIREAATAPGTGKREAS